MEKFYFQRVSFLSLPEYKARDFSFFFSSFPERGKLLCLLVSEKFLLSKIISLNNSLSSKAHCNARGLCLVVGTMAVYVAVNVIKSIIVSIFNIVDAE